MRIWFKLYPCVATVQGVIYTLTKLIDEHRFGADEVEEIRVGISETSVSHGGAIYEPHDTASAQFSLPFSLGDPLVEKRQRSELLHGSETLDRSESSRAG